MYVIVTYDVDAKRCTKVMKIMRKYLFHVQKSVFEGEITPKQLNNLQTEINKVIQNDNDTVFYYYTYNEKQVYKTVQGNVICNKKNIIV